jgi:hypothetical protein
MTPQMNLWVTLGRSNYVRALAAISNVDTRQIPESRKTNHCRDKPARARRARAMQEKIYENLRNPARASRAPCAGLLQTSGSIKKGILVNTQRKPKITRDSQRAE